jgi:tetratricopeptide (TPR) repeat protein
MDGAEILKRAIAHHQAGHLAEAEQMYRQILRQQPQNTDALTLLGVIACQQGKLEEGIMLYRQALTLRPEHRQARDNLSLALWKQGKRLIDEAMLNLNQIVNFQPNNFQAHDTLATIFQDQGLLEQALTHYQLAIAANPNDSAGLNGTAVVLHHQGKPHLAAHFHRRVLANQPDNLDALIGLSKAMLDQGYYQEALAYINKALKIAPDNAIARYNRALMLLQQGEFQTGFPEYEWRLKTPEFPPCPFRQPVWDGSDLNGKTLLLHAEQGLGDTIQFIRYAAIATQKGGRVIFTCHRPLIRLLSGIPGIEEFIPLGLPLPEFHVYAPLLSLPGILGTTLATVPAQVPYLQTPATGFQLPITQASTASKLKVGLVWAGGSLYKHNHSRSFSLRVLEPILHLPNLTCYSLQKGIPQLEITELGWQDRIHDLSGTLNDMADTAAAIAQLDLVITVDTAVAHLAGALAKPVWVLLAHVPDWRWMLERTDSPWYPTMRLFRQGQAGDWPGVMQQVATALTSFTAA